MSSAKTLPSYPSLALYPTLAGAAEATITFWSEYLRTTQSAALWWTERWLQAPTFYRAWTKTVAPVVEETVPLTRDVAQEVVTPVEEATEVVAEAVAEPVEQVAPVIEAAVEALRPEPDDLTLLVGIGPKLAAALSKRGVRHFAQIAAWTEQDIAEVDKALDLKGRAVRDAWIAQAKRFATTG